MFFVRGCLNHYHYYNHYSLYAIITFNYSLKIDRESCFELLSLLLTTCPAMGNLVLLCRGKDFLILDLTHRFNFFLYTFVVWFLGNCRLLLSLRSSETVSFCSLIIVLPLQIYIVQQRSLFSLQGLHNRSDKVSLRFNSKPMDSHAFAKIKFWLSCLSDGLI
jgi:hypothetical protein